MINFSYVALGLYRRSDLYVKKQWVNLPAIGSRIEEFSDAFGFDMSTLQVLMYREKDAPIDAVEVRALVRSCDSVAAAIKSSGGGVRSLTVSVSQLAEALILTDEQTAKLVLAAKNTGLPLVVVPDNKPHNPLLE